MLTSIRSRIQALVLSSLVFASIALLSASGGAPAEATTTAAVRRARLS